MNIAKRQNHHGACPEIRKCPSQFCLLYVHDIAYEYYHTELCTTHNVTPCFLIGKVKAIGVSNYTTRHLEELLTYATIKPHVLQVGWCSLSLHSLVHRVL